MTPMVQLRLQAADLHKKLDIANGKLDRLDKLMETAVYMNEVFTVHQIKAALAGLNEGKSE